MTSTERRLTPEELCAIIKACGETGVTELKFGDLQVQFGKPTEPKTPSQPLVLPLADEIADAQMTEAKHALEEDEARVKQDRLADLWITDPLRAEELLANGELTDDGTTDDEEA